MSRRPTLAAAAAALVLITGCTGEPVPGPASSPTVNPTSPAQLAAQKKAAAIADCPKSSATVAPVEKGLPDLVLPCLGGGREVRLAGLRGQPMMINVWAQWCPPCREEAPLISDVATQNTSDLMILGIDWNDPYPNDALLFAQLSAWRYPQLADRDKTITGPLQLNAVPRTYFVRADGTIAAQHTGQFRSTDQIKGMARQALGVTL